MKRMEIKGIDFAYITLHAGLGNFRDIDVEDLTKHKTDSEQMIVNAEAVNTVNRAKDKGKNVCAVGTTVMRAIESAVSTDGHLKEFEGWTNKFIFPPYEFTVANSMISNKTDRIKQFRTGIQMNSGSISKKDSILSSSWYNQFI